MAVNRMNSVKDGATRRLLAPLGNSNTLCTRTTTRSVCRFFVPAAVNTTTSLTPPFLIILRRTSGKAIQGQPAERGRVRLPEERSYVYRQCVSELACGNRDHDVTWTAAVALAFTTF